MDEISSDVTESTESILSEVLPSPPASLGASVSPKQSYRKKKEESKFQKDALMANAMKILEAPADSQQIFGDFIAEELRCMLEEKQKRLKLLIQYRLLLWQRKQKSSHRQCQILHRKQALQYPQLCLIPKRNTFVKNYVKKLTFILNKKN